MGTSTTRYTAEFKTEAVRQVIERGHPVREVAARLDVSAWSLHQWERQHREGKPPGSPPPGDQAAEIHRLKAELRRMTEGRDISKKKTTAYFAQHITQRFTLAQVEPASAALRMLVAHLEEEVASLRRAR
jgi:transposase